MSGEVIVTNGTSPSKRGKMTIMDQEVAQSSSTESTSPVKSTRRSLMPRLKPGKLSPSATNVINAEHSRKRGVSLNKVSLRRNNRGVEDAGLPLDTGSVNASLASDKDTHDSVPPQSPSPVLSLGSGFRRTQRRKRRGRVEQEHATRKSFLRGLNLKSFSKESRNPAKDGTYESEQSPKDYPSIAEQTKVVAEVGTSPARTYGSGLSEEREDIQERLPDFSCATAILEHHFLERLCGTTPNESFPHIHSGDLSHLPEDPTTQESIECIFAAQLEDGLSIWDEEHDEQVVESRNPDDLVLNMVSPSLLQQSRQNRSDRLALSLSQSRKRYEQASLVYVGTFDPTITHEEVAVKDNRDGPLQCQCERSCMPSLAPEDWPQAPILLRPTPGQGTKIKGVRLGNEKEYLWEPGSHVTWSQILAQRWGEPHKPGPRVACCERCAVLPINNGNELENESFSIDFESDLFVGTLLLRIRYSEGTTKTPYDDTVGYFKGLNRCYQAVIQGKFKKCLPFFELYTGIQFPRPCGRLPAKWILRGGIKVVSFFAPQLDCNMEGDKPHSLTPLGSTPLVICVDNEETVPSISAPQQEPTEDHRSILGHTSSSLSSLQRSRARKKAFDKLFVQKSEEPRTDPSKIYTFQFVQHMFNYQEFSMELGSMLGSVDLKDLLDGQPLQIMAAHGDQRLWSFEIWHEKLWADAQKHDLHLQH